MKDDKEYLAGLLTSVTQADINEIDESRNIINGEIGAYLLTQYKENVYWGAKNRIRPMLEELIFGEKVGIQSFNYTSGPNSELCQDIHDRFDKIYRPIHDRVVSWVETQAREYTITQHFGKKFSVEGCNNVRKVINSPVPNTYVLKKGPGELTVAICTNTSNPTSETDFTRVPIWVDDHKELAMCVRHAYLKAKASVQYNLIDRCERGELRESPSFKFDCFMTEEDWDQAVKMTMMTCKEKTYNVVSYGSGTWATLQVLCQDSTEQKRELHKSLDIIVNSVSYSKAREIYSKISSVYSTNSHLDNLAVTRDRLRKELDSVSKRIQEQASVLAEERMTLTTALDNNTLGVGVKEKVEQYLNTQS